MQLCVFTLKCIEQQSFVVAAEANDFIGRPLVQEFHEELNYPATVGPRSM